MPRFRKKPVIIEAVQFNGFDKLTGQVILSERPKWLTEQFGKKVVFFDKPNTLTIIGAEGKGNFPEYAMGIDSEDDQLKITTLEGVMIANIGDWIIKGVKGEFYPCKPDIFDATYELAEIADDGEGEAM